MKNVLLSVGLLLSIYSCKKNTQSIVEEKYPIISIKYRIVYTSPGTITPSVFRAYYWQNDTSILPPSYGSEQRDWGAINYGVNEKITTLRKGMGYYLRAHSLIDGTNWKLYVINENGSIIDSSKPPYPFNQALGYYDVMLGGEY